MLIKVSFGVFFSEYSAKFHSNNSFESRLLFETKSKPPLVKCTCIADKQRLVELSISFYRTPIFIKQPYKLLKSFFIDASLVYVRIKGYLCKISF